MPFLDYFRAIFGDGATWIAGAPLQAIGGKNPSGVYKILNLDASGNLVVNTATAVGTATLTNVASSASSVQLIAANTGRVGLVIFNDSTQRILVKFGITASATSFTMAIASQGSFILPTPIYTGRIDGIWDSANGNARLTEITA